MKINILTMTTSLSSVVVLLAALIFSDGRNSVVVVVNGYNIDKIDSGCSKNTDSSVEMKNQALMSIDSAIRFVVYGHSNRCALATGSTVHAAANCSHSIPTDDCKLCLYNAQYRVVETECPGVTGGWLALTDCYVRFDTDTRFCHPSST